MQVNSLLKTTLVLVIAATLCGLSIFRIRTQLTSTWVRIPGVDSNQRSPNDPEGQLRDELEQLSDSGLPRRGIKAELAVFKGVGDREISIWLIEGTLNDSSIEPDESWKGLGKRLLLVNSVDDQQSIPDSGIAAHIGLGCQLHATHRLALGDVEIMPCRGPYQNLYGIDSVANVGIVVPSSAFDDSCYKSIPEGERNLCLENALAASLRTLSSKLADAPQRPTAILFPALVTGHGGLLKTSSYKVLLEGLHEWMKSAQIRNALPERVYLLVWTGDSVPWDVTKEAIINRLSSLVAAWKREDHLAAGVADMASLGGVSAGIVVVMVFALSRGSLPGLTKQLGAIRSGDVFLLVTAWYLSSLGAMGSLRSALPGVQVLANPVSLLVLGFLTVFMAGALLKSHKKFEELTVESKGFHRPGTPDC